MKLARFDRWTNQSLKIVIFFTSVAALPMRVGSQTVTQSNSMSSRPTPPQQTDSAIAALSIAKSQTQLKDLRTLSADLRTANNTNASSKSTLFDIEIERVLSAINDANVRFEQLTIDLYHHGRFAHTNAAEELPKIANIIDQRARDLSVIANQLGLPDATKKKAATATTAGIDAAKAIRDAATADAVAFPPDSMRTAGFPTTHGGAFGAQCFWANKGKTIAPGLNLASSGKGQPAVLGADLYEDFFDQLHFTVSTAVSASDSPDDIKANAQRFLQKGGTLAAGVGYALAFVGSTYVCKPDGSMEQKAGITQLRVSLQAREGFDLPQVGAQTADATGNTDIGVDADLQLIGIKNVAKFFVRTHIAAAIGGTAWSNSIGRASSGAFRYGQANIGLVLGDAFLISGSFPIFAPKDVRPQLRGVLNIGLSQTISTGSQH